MRVFVEGVNQDDVILIAARASQTENQDATDTAIVGVLADQEVMDITSSFIYLCLDESLIISF